jgi:hypothetical protein
MALNSDLPHKMRRRSLEMLRRSLKYVALHALRAKAMFCPPRTSLGQPQTGSSRASTIVAVCGLWIGATLRLNMAKAADEEAGVVFLGLTRRKRYIVATAAIGVAGLPRIGKI